MAGEVFICHANQDRAVAEAICAKLEDNGIRCWLAPRDVIAGEDWDKAITRALDQSRILVLVFSASSNESDYCINEVNIAFDNKEDIIPFFIDDTIPSGAMQLYLKRKQWLNAQKPPLEPHLEKLVSEVKGHIAQATAREEAAAREKARREEAARLLREAEEKKKSLEAAAAQKKAEEAENLKKQVELLRVSAAEEAARVTAAAEKARKEAEEAVKEKALREAEAARARQEAEAAVKEKERREAEVAKARKESEAADKARKAAEKARKEAEAAVKEKEVREAEAASARQEAEAAIKEKELREAEAAKARQETEAAKKASEAALKAKKEAEAARRALKREQPRKAGTGWLWSGAFFTFVGLGAALWFALFSNKLNFSAQWPKNPMSPLYPQWPFMLLISLPGIIIGIIFLRHWATSYEHDETVDARKSGWWWAFPIFLGVVGGIIAWVNHKNINWRHARNMLTTGILLTLLLPAALLVFTKAAPVVVIPGNTGTISGHVYQSDGKTPIPNLSVNALDSTTREKKASTSTDANGYYMLSSLPKGNYLVGTWSGGSGSSYVDKWYDGALSQSEAQPVAVDALANIGNIDFRLEAGGATAAAATTPAKSTTPPPPPNEYLEVDFNPTSFDKTDINGGETFTAQLSGTITCLKDIPFDVSGVAIIPQVIARNTSGGADTTLQCSSNITLDVVPSKTGDKYDFKQSLPLQFTQQAATGDYHIVMKMKDARVNIGLWVDVADYFDLTGELSLGNVKLSSAVLPYNYVEGYVRAAGSTPIAGATVELIDTAVSNGKTSDTVIAVGQSNSSGYYKTSPFSTNGPYLLRATISGYETQWYNNTNEQTQATKLYFQDGGETLRVDFLMQPSGSISGTVTSDADGQGIANVNITAFDYVSSQAIKSVNTSSDGTYKLTDVPAGSYRIKAAPSSGKLSYADEYYKDSYDYWNIQAVTLTTGQHVSGIDFSLAPGGTVSGTVRNTDGSATLANVVVEAFRIVGGNWQGWSAATDSQGKYTIYGVPYSQVFVRARGINSDYVLEYYPGVSRQSLATLLTVSKDSNPVNIDFTLDSGGSISGKIISKTTLAAIPYVHIDVLDFDTNEWVGCADTAADGTFTVHSLATGKYRVQVSSTLNNLPYLTTYYQDTTNSVNATPVFVTAGKDTPNINFSLTPTG